MPNYAISVTSDDNMVIASAASETSLTVEQYLKVIVHEHAMKLKEKLS